MKKNFKKIIENKKIQKKEPKYGIRKLKVGVVSCLLAFAMTAPMTLGVKAADNTTGSGSGSTTSTTSESGKIDAAVNLIKEKLPSIEVEDLNAEAANKKTIFDKIQALATTDEGIKEVIKKIKEENITISSNGSKATVDVSGKKVEITITKKSGGTTSPSTGWIKNKDGKWTYVPVSYTHLTLPTN